MTSIFSVALDFPEFPDFERPLLQIKKIKIFNLGQRLYGTGDFRPFFGFERLRGAVESGERGGTNRSLKRFKKPRYWNEE
jgi:hypothetical protein